LKFSERQTQQVPVLQAVKGNWAAIILKELELFKSKIKQYVCVLRESLQDLGIGVELFLTKMTWKILSFLNLNLPRCLCFLILAVQEAINKSSWGGGEP
jgi:hypothetical protein